jgi:hypothetical protein
MGRRSLAAAVSAVTLAVAGCASSAGQGAPVGGGTGSEVPRPPAGLVVFQLETSGGFVPIDYALGTQPTLTIYGDGTAFATVEEDTYHPVVAMRQGSVDAGTLDQLIAAASSAGVFGVDYGMPGVTDVGTTTLDFRPQQGALRTASAYALGFGDDAGASGLSTEQQERRHALGALIRDLVRSVTYPADGGVWTPTRVEVIDLADSPPGDTPSTAWPGPDLTSLLTLHADTRRCGVLVGDEAATVFAAARAAKSSAWTADDKTYHLLVRALLPGEDACTA